MEIKKVATNRKAYHNYYIEEVIEAGIVLSGSEVKSIRMGRISLGEAYIKPRGEELWLVGAHVPRYEASSVFTAKHEANRDRKLLLHRNEINALARKVREKGYTLIPVSLYIKGHLIKAGVGLGRGKKQYEKKDAIIEKEVKRQISRTLKNQT